MRTQGAIFSKLLREFPGLCDYYRNVIEPYERATLDDGYLAIFVNRQITFWEADTHSPDGDPDAAEITALLNVWLEAIRGRIRDRIATAELSIVRR